MSWGNYSHEQVRLGALSLTWAPRETNISGRGKTESDGPFQNIKDKELIQATICILFLMYPYVDKILIYQEPHRQ